MSDSFDEPAPQRVGVREFRGDFTGFLRQASNGQSFLITSHGQVVAEVRPPRAHNRPHRQPGELRGSLAMAPDFDAMPPDLSAAMEGET